MEASKRRSRMASSIVRELPTQAKALEQRAEVGLKKVAHSAAGLAKKHPAVTAGALVGAGVLVGVVAQRTLHHEPTVGEVVAGAIKRGAAKVSKRLSSGASAGMRAGKATVRRALK